MAYLGNLGAIVTSWAHANEYIKQGWNCKEVQRTECIPDPIFKTACQGYRTITDHWDCQPPARTAAPSAPAAPAYVNVSPTITTQISPQVSPVMQNVQGATAPVVGGTSQSMPDYSGILRQQQEMFQQQQKELLEQQQKMFQQQQEMLRQQQQAETERLRQQAMEAELARKRAEAEAAAAAQRAAASPIVLAPAPAPAPASFAPMTSAGPAATTSESLPDISVATGAAPKTGESSIPKLLPTAGESDKTGLILLAALGAVAIVAASKRKRS